MELVKPAATLLIMSAIAVFLIGVVYDITREPVRIQQYIRRNAMIADLLPGTERSETEYIHDNPNVSQLVSGYDAAGNHIGYAVVAQAPGYAGAVVIMTGFNNYGTLTGVRIMNHRETPGLGTAIEHMRFLEQFENRTDTMSVVRMATADDEIQALASATISTVAVVDGINAAMDFIRGYLN